MSLSTLSSADKGYYYNGTTGRNPKPLGPKSKFDSIFKQDLVTITEKSVMLAKIKNSPGKPAKVYAYKVQKLRNFGRKPISPRIPKPRNAKEPEDMFDEDLPTLGNDDGDLTPRNKNENLTTQNSYENKTQNDQDYIDIDGRDDFLCVWQELDAISMCSELTDSEQPSDQSLSEYLFLENQTTVDVSFNLKKEYAYQDTELIIFGNKTFRSQQTSTNDLFKFRKLSGFASTILLKCHELEQMQFNTFGSSSQGIVRLDRDLTLPRLPTIPEENAQGDTKVSQDCSDKKLSVYKDEGKPFGPECPHLGNTNSNLMWYFILAIIGLLIFIVGIIYVRHQLRTPEPPKPFWQQYLSNLINFLYFYK